MMRQMWCGVALVLGTMGGTLSVASTAQAQTDWYGYGVMRQQTINGMNLRTRARRLRAAHRGQHSRHRVAGRRHHR